MHAYQSGWSLITGIFLIPGAMTFMQRSHVASSMYALLFVRIVDSSGKKYTFFQTIIWKDAVHILTAST